MQENMEGGAVYVIEYQIIPLLPRIFENINLITFSVIKEPKLARL